MWTGIGEPACRWTTTTFLMDGVSLERLVGHLFERHDLAATIAPVGGDEKHRLRVVDAVTQRLRAEAAEDDAVHGADARTGEHGDGELGNERQVEGDAVALLHAQRFEHVGEGAHLPEQVPVGQGAPVTRLAFPDDGGAIAPRAVRVAIDAVGADVQLAADEPLRVGRFPAHHVGPGFNPVQLAGERRPEGLGIGRGTVVDGRVRDDGAGLPFVRWWETAVFSEQIIDFGHKGAF